MKKLAIPILVFSLAGLVSLFLPMERGSMATVWLEVEPMHLVLMALAFGVPAAVSALSLARPVQHWQSYAALAGYAVAVMKTEVWSLVGKLGGAPVAVIVLFVAVVCGAIATILAFAKEQEAAA